MLRVNKMSLTMKSFMLENALPGYFSQIFPVGLVGGSSLFTHTPIEGQMSTTFMVHTMMETDNESLRLPKKQT